MMRLSIFVFVFIFALLSHQLSATVFWEGCQSESDYPKQTEGNFFNLCILDELFEGKEHSWMFTKAVIKRTTFSDCTFTNLEGAPNNFTEAVWEDVDFDGCRFGSKDIKYGYEMVFDRTRFTNVQFRNTLFHSSVDTIFSEFKFENVSFVNCSFAGNTVFTLGTVTNVQIQNSKFAANIDTMSPGNNQSLYFKDCSISSLSLKGNEFANPIRFEAVDAEDVALNETIFDRFYCHSYKDNDEKNGKIERQSRFNITAMDECQFNGKVFCEETTWNGFYAANLTFNHHADFSRSEIVNIYWDGISSRLDASNPECRLMNFSQSNLLRNTFANITIDCNAEFLQTTFTQVRVRNFFAKNHDFDSAVFVEQEYIDSQCCTLACKSLQCKCNVSEPSGSCPVGKWPVNVTAPKPVCFPGDATVQKVGGQVITMEELALREKIAVGNNQHSDIYFFGHRDSNEDTQFIQITHTGCTQSKQEVITSKTAIKPLRLSASHYLYTNGQLKNAGSVRVGDRLRDESGKDTLIVTDIEKVNGKGAFAPTSLHGDLLVDGVIVSSYTDAIHPTLAHRLLHPLRLMYRAGLHELVSRFTMFERRSWENVARMLNIPQGPAVIES